MLEPIMYIGIGFLVAGLLVIGVIPLVHARAVRLTMRRLEALTPLSMAEIQADKDQLRAEFAMSTRRLEMNVEQMKAKTTNQLAEIGKTSSPRSARRARRSAASSSSSARRTRPCSRSKPRRSSSATTSSACKPISPPRNVGSRKPSARSPACRPRLPR